MTIPTTTAIRQESLGARDEELVRLAATGDGKAFDALLRPRIDRLFRLAMAITRSEPDARDATQDACVLAWRELPQLRVPESFDSWLSRIVVNSARAIVRRTGSARVHELSVVADGGEARGWSEPATPAEVETFTDSDAIRRAFGRLDGSTRVLLVLHYVEGHPLAAIARATGSPLGTVKWRLSNARRALERALEAERR
jgi:RNA polymerase sigma-70 factor (ECF subfamily)